MQNDTSHSSLSSRSAAAMRLDAGARPWYLSATPLVTLPWLIRLHGVSAGIEAVGLAVAWSFPNLDFPLRRISALIAAAMLSNLTVAIWLSRGRALPRAVAAIGLAIDVLLLSGLLELTGGPFNPFAVILAVQVALAALTLGAVYAVAIGGTVAACYGILVYWHNHELVPGHHRLNDFPTHLFAMWVAASMIAELAAYFVVQASNMLARREEQIEAMRRTAARTERVMSLTTLAAGAAHELSTPLATIALAARELERATRFHENVPGLAEDAHLIRAEVDRCRAILDQMSGRAGGMAADLPETVNLGTVMADICGRLPVSQAARLRLTLPQASRLIQLPLAGFEQAILNLINNAFDASDEDVIVTIAQDEERVRLVVRDTGRGMAPDVLQRAGDPFFTTKEPGRGLGLGLFLVRVFAERCGGSLTLDSDNGTTASLELPTRSAVSRTT